MVRSVKSISSCWKKQASITMCIEQKCVSNLIRPHIRPTKKCVVLIYQKYLPFVLTISNQIGESKRGP